MQAVILHLSDLQFGIHHRWTGCDEPNDGKEGHRYKSNKDFQTLFNKLESDLKLLKEQHGLVPNILVISGDIAEWSTIDEYEFARTFVNSLFDSQMCEFSREETILVPGNHDVNWDLSNAYFLICSSKKKKPEIPYWRKFEHWDQFYANVGSLDAYESKRPWQGYDLSRLGILAVGLNSCIEESHREEDHRGYIGIQQAREVRDWFAEKDPNHGLPHIGVLHHNLTPDDIGDEECLRDWNEIRPILEDCLDLVLHGHRHESQRKLIGTLGSRPLVVLGAGSAGLDSETLPASPNQYEIVDLRGSEGTVYLRKFAEEKMSDTGQGCFVPDVDAEGNWYESFSLADVSQSVTDTRAQEELIDHESLIASIAKSTAIRLNEEKHRTGVLLEIPCTSLGEENPSGLFEYIHSWLGSDIPRCLLLGAAGSGKSVASHQIASLCLEEFSDVEDSWLPVVLDLGAFSDHDDALEIVGSWLQTLGFNGTESQSAWLLSQKKVLILLDGFDEYDKTGAAYISDRTFKNFEKFSQIENKIIVTCRSNFFRSPEDVFFYSVRPEGFELCPRDSMVLVVEDLSSEVVGEVLSPYTPDQETPNWLLNLGNRPLYLGMIRTLLAAGQVNASGQINRPTLYKRYIDHALKWDLAHKTAPAISFDESRTMHLDFARQILGRGWSTLPEEILLKMVQDRYQESDCNPLDLYLFFTKSGLLTHRSNHILFVHKSIREYLVAEKIVSNIRVGNDDFGFTWFTRNEREFVLEMLTRSDVLTLCSWLTNESKYPACNYAAFILGGVQNEIAKSALRKQLFKTEDVLVRTNCATALAYLGESTGRDLMIGFIAGYCLDNELITIQPVGCNNSALRWVGELTERFERHVMLVHLCECVDALATIGSAEDLDLLNRLAQDSEQAISDEAHASARVLSERLGLVSPPHTS